MTVEPQPAPVSPPATPETPRRPSRLAAIIGIAALIVGFGGGFLVAKATTSTPEPKNTNTVVSNPACVRALNTANKFIEVSSDFATIVVDLLTAASTFDAAGIEAEGDKIPALTERVRELTPSFQADRDSCLGSG